MIAEPLVRAAKWEDAERALDVLRQSITLLCAADHQNDPQTLELWLGNKTVSSFERWLADTSSALFVAELGGVVRGVAKVTRAGKIELCYVEPGFERRHLGRELLRALEARAEGWGLKDLYLESSLGACAFYARNGYESVGAPREWVGAVRAFPFRKRLRPNS